MSLQKLRELFKKDCPYDLIGLEGKPKKWREVATKEMIKQGHDIAILKKEMAAVIGLCIAILGFIVKLALGG